MTKNHNEQPIKCWVIGVCDEECDIIINSRVKVVPVGAENVPMLIDALELDMDFIIDRFRARYTGIRIRNYLKSELMREPYNYSADLLDRVIAGQKGGPL